MGLILNFRPQLKSIAFSIAFLFLAACGSKAVERSPEKYLIQEDYIGTVYIIFDQKNGMPLTSQDGWLIYEIPASGILVTQNDVNEGVIESDNVKFFYNSDGNLVEIEERWRSSIKDNSESREDPNTYIFGGGIGIYSRTDLNCDIPYKAYYIGTKAQILEGVQHSSVEEVMEQQELTCRESRDYR